MDVFQLMVAIRQIESSNNYKATNPSGALGAYQVMEYHLKDWGLKVFGRVLTRTEFLNSPNLQDAMASAILGEYYDKYGFDGAAAMWFSGQSDPYSQKSDGYNTVQQYVNKARAVLGMPTLSGSPQKSTMTSGGGSGGSKTTAKPVIDQNVLAEQYGLVKGLIDSVPELKTLFSQAVSGGWTSDMFKAKLQNTNWWKTHTEKQRQYLIKSFTDPASFEDDRENAKFKISDMVSQLGLWQITGDQELWNKLIWGVLYEGWSDAELKYNIANYIKFSPEGNLAGAGGQFQDKMASAAWANGVELDKDWYRIYYSGILRGTTTEQQALQDIRNQAAAKFPGFKDQIMAGQNVMDIASPYMQGMASILEINPGSLDLFDTTIVGALNYKGPDGVTGSKPLWQFETELRKDPRWLKTNNAREGLMGVAHKVAQDFGVMY